jgi:phosphoribosylaminoimidazole (AIR) synthetase
MSTDGASYRAAGVDYEVLDAGKRLAMAKALATSSGRSMAARGGRALDASAASPRSCSSWAGRRLAFVVEGLGTKSIDLAAVLEQLGVNRFADVAYDTVAAIVNDLCCVGALPLVVNAYFATGSSEWYLRAGPLGGAASRAGAARARTRAACGAVESPPRSRACWPRATSSSRAPRSARCRRGTGTDPRRGARAGR